MSAPAASPTTPSPKTPTPRNARRDPSPLPKRWVYRDYDPQVATRLESEANLPRLMAELLAQRKITEPEQAARFLSPELSQLHDPFRMLGMRAAVDRLRRAITNREHILIYGDYDVDGTISVVLLKTLIRLAGGEADFHVPHRVREGYGMRREVIERAAADGVQLVITADNGIRETEVIDRARELGLDAIVTDHHLPSAGVPQAVAVLNPNQPGCDYPDKNLCGAGVVLKFAQALLTDLDWPPAKRDRVLRSMLKMVAIATVADLVPLTGENRVFTKLGLEGLRKPKSPGLRALIGVSGLVVSRVLSAGDVGFRLAPRLNAAGRMDDARAVIDLFSSTDSAEVSGIAEKLDRLNSERQRTEDAIVNDILERLGDLPSPDEMPMIVEGGEGWHQGVVGIVASRVIERFHRPTLVLSCDAQTGKATGSARSIPGFHLLEAIESCAEVFDRFGGHRQAAGCTVPIERIPELRRRLNEHARGVLSPEDFIPTLRLDAELPFAEINQRTMEQLARLAPHGIGNPQPAFSTVGVELAAPSQILKKKHIKLRLRHDERTMAAIGWRMAERARGLARGSTIDAAFTVDVDHFNGGWQLTLKDFRDASDKAAD